MTTVPAQTTTHPNVGTLRAVYAELPRIAEFATEDIVLHRADRTPENPHALRGVEAALAHERALVRMTGDTLVMDVAQISANDHFGTVIGVLRATSPREIAMPFCGLWRFVDGRLAEHWENAYDPAALRDLFAPPAA